MLASPVPVVPLSCQSAGTPVPVVVDLNHDVAAVARRLHTDVAGFDAIGEAVSQGVLDEWLDDEHGHARARRLRLQGDLGRQPVAESGALNVEVRLGGGQFVFDRVSLLARVEQPAQQVAHAGDQIHGVLVAAVTDERRDRVEAVEQKVRMELGAERGEPGRVELCLELRGLEFTRAPARVELDRVRRHRDGRINDDLLVETGARLIDERRPHRLPLLHEREADRDDQRGLDRGGHEHRDGMQGDQLRPAELRDPSCPPA